MLKIKFRTFFENTMVDIIEIKFHNISGEINQISFWHNQEIKHLEFHNNIPIMQYTGLKDINGVEIYEGDIVRGVKELGMIAFNKNLCCLVLLSEKGSLTGASLYNCFDVEVMGNIHENPELLPELSKKYKRIENE